MHKFTRAIKNRTGVQLSDSQCEDIKDGYKVSDERGPLSLFNGIWPQFTAHQALDSFDGSDGEKWNRYDGLDNGQGVYPVRMDSPLLVDGRFRTSDAGLPYLAGESKPIELTVDAHRGNEHRALKALHLMACLLHNRRMDDHGNFALAKAETISTLNRVTMNEAQALTGLTESQILNDVVIRDFHLSLEYNFGVGRWAHAMMPDTVNGKPIFEPGNSIDVDVMAMVTTEKSRILDLGVSNSMLEMTHLPSKPHSILERTFARHNELNLACHQDLCAAIAPRDKDRLQDAPQGCPLWPAALMEAERIGSGTLGPVYGRAVADATAGQMLWGLPGQGLWHPRWEAAPRTTADIVDYAFS